MAQEGGSGTCLAPLPSSYNCLPGETWGFPKISGVLDQGPSCNEAWVTRQRGKGSWHWIHPTATSFPLCPPNTSPDKKGFQYSLEVNF